MRYAVRAIKYFVAFVVLYLAVTWLSLRASGLDVSVRDSVLATMRTPRGIALAVAVALLSAAYPKFGFITRRVEASTEEDRERIVTAFETSGFGLAAEEDGAMIFRAGNLLRRLLLLFEDEVRVEQYGQWVEITGIRRAVARAAYRLEWYMDNKRR